MLRAAVVMFSIYKNNLIKFSLMGTRMNPVQQTLYEHNVALYTYSHLKMYALW